MRAQYHLTPFILSIYEIYQREIQKFTAIFTLIVGRGSYDEIQRPQKAQQRYLKLFHVQTIQLNNSFLAKKKKREFSLFLLLASPLHLRQRRLFGRRKCRTTKPLHAFVSIDPFRRMQGIVGTQSALYRE